MIMRVVYGEDLVAAHMFNTINEQVHFRVRIHIFCFSVKDSVISHSKEKEIKNTRLYAWMPIIKRPE